MRLRLELAFNHTLNTQNTDSSVDASLPLSLLWSCTQLSPCCPQCCWWVYTGPPLQSADGGERQHTHNKSWRSGWIPGAFCSHSIPLWPGGASFSVTWARLSLLSITFNQTDSIQEVVCTTRLAKRTKCPVWDNNRDLLAWNERKKYKAGQTVNRSDWPYMRNEQFSLVSGVLLSTGWCTS